jgi:hypothetical protein
MWGPGTASLDWGRWGPMLSLRVDPAGRAGLPVERGVRRWPQRRRPLGPRDGPSFLDAYQYRDAGNSSTARGPFEELIALNACSGRDAVGSIAIRVAEVTQDNMGRVVPESRRVEIRLRWKWTRGGCHMKTRNEDVNSPGDAFGWLKHGISAA